MVEVSENKEERSVWKDRPLYRVNLVLSDGSNSQHDIYADNPEHAVKKASNRHPDVEVTESQVAQLKEGVPW